MAISRRDGVALGAAAALAVIMPLWLLWPGAMPAMQTATVMPALTAPPSPPPLTLVYARTLFGGVGTSSDDDAALPSDAPQLIGIVGRIGSDAVAMVRGTEGTSRTLQIGESVDGWTLESLAIDAAFFTRGGQRVRVPLPAGQ